MADQYGATALPVPVKPDGQPIGDPLLFYLGDFLRTVGNARCGDAWKTLSNEDPIREVFNEDPERNPLEDNALPALWVWRSNFDGGFVQAAEDVRVARSTICVLWINAPSQSETERDQEPFAQALMKCFDAAINRGVDPSWIVEGDKYFNAQRRGSSLARWCQYRKLWSTKTERVQIATQVLDDSKPPPSLTGYRLSLFCEERYRPDLALRGAANKGVQGVIKTKIDPANPAPVLAYEIDD